MTTALILAVLVLGIALAALWLKIRRLERWILDVGLTLAALRLTPTDHERPHQ
ncbi:hypothetical protein [Corynebacterium pyruviciproducens]|uniref:hypothetical protein n=1 Tax=Corynebacterium pyruviciproducens TaxID=598660 RepID=UPI0025510B2B|nr:hypothetical protein [Corynebacterium pyruviciproducens]MDK7213422.1 hypothetical protein [Corynebacterium pyruviciproducens]